MFTKKLLYWHRKYNKRSLPWKEITDPYKIWLSEIILQQTRAEQGLPYYERFLERYPTIFDLAKAPEDELFRMWQGLGYYNRCRNLHSTAKTIVDSYQGEFPSQFQDIRNLKGIGDYTAAAIASFAFRLPHAVVDGNVIRVLSRVFALTADASTASGKKTFQELAASLLDQKQPHLFNQAIMDLGATICTPQVPICDSCPLQQLCKAYQYNTISKFPCKKKKAPLKDRYFHFLIPDSDKELFILRREERDIWRGLYLPVFFESESEKPPSDIKTLSWKKLPLLAQTKQILSHQRIHGMFYEVPLPWFSKHINTSIQKINTKNIKDFPFPRTVISFFHKKNYL